MAFATRITRTHRLPDGSTRSTRSRVWYACWRDPATGKWRRKAGYTDKRLTEQLARRLEREAIEVREGLRHPTAEHRARPVAELAAEYRQHLLDQGRGDDHARNTHSKIAAVADGCGWATAADLDAESAGRWLARQRRERARFGASTHNHYVTALRAFGRWLADTGRAPTHPFTRLAKVNAAADPRHRRRSLTSTEQATLFATTRASPRVSWGLDGPARAALYTTACYTGLRAEELSRITPAHLRLDVEPPTLTLTGAEDKAKRGDTIPLHPAAVAVLTGIAANTAAGEPLWPGGWWRDGAVAMLRRDLAAADIPYRDDRGEYADFHALRTTFVTNLARAGVPLQAAIRLARVTDAKLITHVYTRLRRDDLAAEVGKVPPPAPPAEPQARTRRRTRRERG